MKHCIGVLLLFTSLYSHSQERSCFIKIVDSLFSSSSNSVEYSICIGELIGLSTVKKPCIDNPALMVDSISFDEKLFILNAFRDSLNDWSALIILEANDRYGGTESSTFFYNNIAEWRKQQKWIDLGFWLRDLGFVENSVFNNKEISGYDFISAIEKRVFFFEKMTKNESQFLLIAQMRYLFNKLLSDLNFNGNKINNYDEKRVKSDLLLLSIIDDEICKSICFEKNSNGISKLLFLYFMKSNTFLYDYSLWLIYGDLFRK